MRGTPRTYDEQIREAIAARTYQWRSWRFYLGGGHLALTFQPRTYVAWRWMFAVRPSSWSYRKRWGFMTISMPPGDGWGGSIGLGYLGFSFQTQPRMTRCGYELKMLREAVFRAYQWSSNEKEIRRAHRWLGIAIETSRKLQDGEWPP